MSYNIHSVDPEFDKLTLDMAISIIDKLDAIWISLSTFFSSWWYKKQRIPTVEMMVRTELRIIDSPNDCMSDVDLDDLIYVDINKIE